MIKFNLSTDTQEALASHGLRIELCFAVKGGRFRGLLYSDGAEIWSGKPRQTRQAAEADALAEAFEVMALAEVLQ